MPERRGRHEDGDRHVAAGREDRRRPGPGEDRRGLRHGSAEADRVEDEVRRRARRSAASGATSRRNGIPAARTSRGLEAPMTADPQELGASSLARVRRVASARAAIGRRREPGRCARPCPRPRSADASFHVPVSTVSREIDRRIPTAVRLIVSDDPPALMNGSVMPVIGTSATTTPMLMNAWTHSQVVMPAASSAAERVGRRERGPDALVGDDDEQRRSTSAPPMRPNSSPMMAKMKSLQAFGRNRPPASRLSPSPAPTIPPRARAMSPWIVWKPVPGGSLHGSMNARMRSSWYGWLAMTDADPAERRPAEGAPRWTRFAPAMKNIVTAVSPMTALVPRSGSRSDEARRPGTMMTRNVTVPHQNSRTAAAALGEPVGEVDDERELGELGRVEQRQRPDAGASAPIRRRRS